MNPAHGTLRCALNELKVGCHKKLRISMCLPLNHQMKKNVICVASSQNDLGYTFELPLKTLNTKIKVDKLV